MPSSGRVAGAFGRPARLLMLAELGLYDGRQVERADIVGVLVQVSLSARQCALLPLARPVGLVQRREHLGPQVPAGTPRIHGRGALPHLGCLRVVTPFVGEAPVRHSASYWSGFS